MVSRQAAMSEAPSRTCCHLPSMSGIGDMVCKAHKQQKHKQCKWLGRLHCLMSSLGTPTPEQPMKVENQCVWGTANVANQPGSTQLPDMRQDTPLTFFLALATQAGTPAVSSAARPSTMPASRCCCSSSAVEAAAALELEAASAAAAAAGVDWGSLPAACLSAAHKQ